MGMTTLQTRSERGDVITRFRITERVDRVDRKALFMTVEQGRGVCGVNWNY